MATGTGFTCVEEKKEGGKKVGERGIGFIHGQKSMFAGYKGGRNRMTTSIWPKRDVKE